MIRLDINDDQIKRAKELYDFKRLNNSIMKGKSNIFGALGEILIYDRYKSVCEYSGSYDHDLIIKDKKVDVKTKKTTVVPKPYYFCSIADFNTSQECDYYCFVRVEEAYFITKRAWLLGWKEKNKFFEEAKFYREGDIDPTDVEWTFRADCWNLEVSKLE